MRTKRLAATAAAAAVSATVIVGCYPAPLNYHWAATAAPAVAELESHFGIIAMTYPGHDPDMAHAADFMLPGNGYNASWVARGYQLAAYAQTDHVRLHVHYIVYRQHIWNVQRNAEGWRLMPNRGDWTQNHMNHVHISFF